MWVWQFCVIKNAQTHWPVLGMGVDTNIVIPIPLLVSFTNSIPYWISLGSLVPLWKLPSSIKTLYSCKLITCCVVKCLRLFEVGVISVGGQYSKKVMYYTYLFLSNAVLYLIAGEHVFFIVLLCFSIKWCQAHCLITDCKSTNRGCRLTAYVFVTFWSSGSGCFNITLGSSLAYC